MTQAFAIVLVPVAPVDEDGNEAKIRNMNENKFSLPRPVFGWVPFKKELPKTIR